MGSQKSKKEIYLHLKSISTRVRNKILFLQANVDHCGIPDLMSAQVRTTIFFLSQLTSHFSFLLQECCYVWRPLRISHL